MGFNFDKDDFTITDNDGNIKFSIERKMPAILFSISNIINIEPVFPNTTVTSVKRRDEYQVVSNELINNRDYFVLPFFKIVGGVADTGNLVATGGGSTVLRVIRQPTTGEYLGSSLLSTIIEGNVLKLVVDHAADRGTFRNISGDTAVTISYKVIYGRFT